MATGITSPRGYRRGAGGRFLPRLVSSTVALIIVLAAAARARPPLPHHQDGLSDGSSQPRYTLTVHLTDAGTGLPTAARIRVIDSLGQDVCPLPQASHFYHQAYTGHRYFYADGEFTVSLPPGRTILWVSKGFEYWAYQDTFSVGEDGSTRGERAAPLSRFADLPALGWRSGDTHVHTNHGGGQEYDVGRADAALMQRAEDLHVANLLENQVEFTPGIDPVSRPDYLLAVGGEYRSAFWGHLDVLGVESMPYLFCCSTGQPAFPMNVDLVRDARNRGGMVFFAHPLTVPRDEMHITDQGWPSTGHGRELPIDVALGTIDALDIYSYSNLNRIEFQVWYDLLNHGFRLPATAGTDASVNRTTDPPMGGYRVYAQVGPGVFTHAEWLESLRRGESFVTNGPLVRAFRVGGTPPGSVITRTPAESYSIPVTFDVVSQWPITRVELLVSGSVARTFIPGGDKRSFAGGTTANLGGNSGWVALRVYGTWENPGPFFTFGTVLYAHTSPVYVDVAGHPRLFGGPDPLSYVDWIDEVWGLADQRGWASPADRDTALTRVSLARSIVLSRTTLAPPSEVSGPGRAAGPAPASAPVLVRARQTAGAVKFEFVGAPAAPETFELFDVQGRSLMTRRLLQLDVSREGWVWSPGQPEGPTVPGIYFARFRGPGWAAVARVVLPGHAGSQSRTALPG